VRIIEWDRALPIFARSVFVLFDPAEDFSCSKFSDRQNGTRLALPNDKFLHDEEAMAPDRKVWLTSRKL
jgi:hypothetical protein